MDGGLNVWYPPHAQRHPVYFLLSSMAVVRLIRLRTDDDRIEAVPVVRRSYSGC